MRVPRPALRLALVIALLGTASTAAVADAAPGRWPSPDTATAVVPLARAHAHNDYEHHRPLLDALDRGFTSVEADIHLVDGRLLVAHDAVDTDPGRTLESLYLDPLRARVRERGGSVHGDRRPFTLLIDVKTEAGPTYQALHRVLLRYGDLLTSSTGGRVRAGTVTAIVSGNRDRAAMEAQRHRVAFYDGRLTDLGGAAPASLIPLISDNWTNQFTWRGRGPMPEPERAKLRQIVDTAHARGQRVRFWATPDTATPFRPAVWRELVAAGVDHLNSDDLAGLQAFLLAEDRTVPGGPHEDPLVATFRRTTRATEWRRAAAIDLSFDAFHPQGMTRVGDRLFISSVEITEPTQRYPQPVDGYDRTPGAGVGHLFEIDAQGRMVADLRLGEGAMYHPGGIDFDGTSIWVPVAEYRPNSRAIVYRVDPVTMTVQEAFRVDDHIGGVVADPEDHRVVGVSWGSRTLYRWNERGSLDSTAPNESHFVDYQDCEHAAGATMICSGVADLRPDAATFFPLGGLALVDTDDLTVGHEVPITVRSDGGQSLTRNPVLVETIPGGLRLTAVPDDGDAATLYVYEATVP